MNEATRTYWNELWQGKEKPVSVSAWSFGQDPDGLAQLVIDGIKTATCSGYVFYERDNERLPAINDYNIILDSHHEPVVTTRTTDVQMIPMNEVPETFAVAEGEGDRTYRYWWQVHEQFFREELQAYQLTFSEDMLLVCERFEVVDIKQSLVGRTAN